MAYKFLPLARSCQSRGRRGAPIPIKLVTNLRGGNAAIGAASFGGGGAPRSPAWQGRGTAVTMAQHLTIKQRSSKDQTNKCAALDVFVWKRAERCDKLCALLTTISDAGITGAKGRKDRPGLDARPPTRALISWPGMYMPDRLVAEIP